MKTDSQIQLDVMAELKWEPSVHATQIGVEVKDGVVTLAGHVGTYAEKWGAEQAAQRVAGVKALAVEIEIKLTDTSERSDGDIAASVKNVLDWTTYLPRNAVHVMVEKGWVTLTGKVDWEYQRQTAANAVRHLMGVRGISNSISISINAVTTATTVKSDIEAAFKRRTKSDIHVDVSGSDVTLTGTVHTWAQRDLATDAAWGTAGVHSVVNRINVVY